MLDAFAEGLGDRWAEGPIDRGLAIRLGQIASDLRAAGVTAGDLRRAGAWAREGWRTPGPLTPSWCATTGRLADAVTHGRHAESSPTAVEAGWTVIRGGRAASGPPGDERPVAVGADPPAR